MTRTSLHKIPKYWQQRKQLTILCGECLADFGAKFAYINNTRSRSSFICVRHFTSDVYSLDVRICADHGIATKKPLNRGDVSTIISTNEAVKASIFSFINGRSMSVTTALRCLPLDYSWQFSVPSALLRVRSSNVRGAHGKTESKKRKSVDRSIIVFCFTHQ